MTSRMTEGFQLIHNILKLRWVPEIIGTIGEGYHSYNQISKNIEYVSNTELNRKLALLLERNAIKKKAIDGHMGYILLPFGEDLDHIFNHFVEMGEKYLN